MSIAGSWQKLNPGWWTRKHGKFGDIHVHVAMAQLQASAGECQGLVLGQINDI